MQEGIFDEFSRAVVEKVNKFKMGGGMDPNTTLGPLISQGAVDRVCPPQHLMLQKIQIKSHKHIVCTYVVCTKFIICTYYIYALKQYVLQNSMNQHEAA